VSSHPSDKFDVQWGSIESLEFRHRIFQSVEPIDRIFERVPTEHIGKEILRLPLAIKPIEIRAFLLDDSLKNGMLHVVTGLSENLDVAELSVSTNLNRVSSGQTSDQGRLDDD